MSVSDVLETAPSKVIAVHLNYPSRAAQRGRTPEFPSYFLKPPSSLSVSGAPLVRPSGCELLAFEGEVAIVIGERTRNVSPEDAWPRVRWVTAANDAGVYDLRYADRGSNLRSKGSDGFTPIGPRLLDARAIDPSGLRLRTWLNGVCVQDDTIDALLFDFGLLVADLSRTITLEAGDVILTGTPAGTSVAVPGDIVEVEVSCGALTTGRLRNPVVESSEKLASYGAQPRVDDATRAEAGVGPVTPVGLSDEVAALLKGVGTATLCSQLRKRGLNNVTIDGVRPAKAGLRMVGLARTLRFLPLREDLFAEVGGGMNAQKRAVESVQPGEVLVMETRQEPTAGTIGDILALRVKMRGGVGVVTDGAVRDSAALASLDLPLFWAAEHPAVLGRRHVPWEINATIACGGTAVQPGDVIVGDDDGVVVIPRPLVDEVARAATDQELQERFIAEKVAQGAAIGGLYPLGPAWQEQFDQWRQEQ